MATFDKRTEDGASAVEYGLMVSGVAGLIVAVVFLFGGTLGALFDDSCGTIANEVKGNTSCVP